MDQRREPTRRADAVPGRPTRLPRRGRQSLRWPGGIESWVASDDELTGAWAITPSRFLFERALPQLVEVPSLWVRVPLRGRDPEELLEPITSIVTEHGLPEPHLVVTGQGAVVVLWHIRPLHRPGALKAEATPEDKTKHDRMTAAYSMGLVAWRRAAVKLAFAFAAVGAEPLTAATADAQLLEHIPFPLGPAHPVRLIKDLHEDPPSLLQAKHHDPLLIKDISIPLGRYDGAMWQAFKASRPVKHRNTKWLETPASLRALATTGSGDRHGAALTIVCACIWDGLDEHESLKTLRDWQARCLDDGQFPWRRKSGDELQHLVRWAVATLSPGGPTPRRDRSNGGGGGGSGGRPLSAIDQAADRVLHAVIAAGGHLETTLQELRRDAALATEGAGAIPKPISRSTLKRALAALKEGAFLTQEVSRVGRTWCSTFALLTKRGALPPRAAKSERQKTADLGDGVIGLSLVQKEESLWVPISGGLLDGGGPGDASPAGSGVRGEGRAEILPLAAEPSDVVQPPTPPASADPIKRGAEDLGDDGVGPGPSPENDPLAGSRHKQRKPRRRRKVRLPVQAPLSFEAPAPGAAVSPPKPAAGIRRARRRRRRGSDELPLVTSLVMDEVRPILVDAPLRRQLQEAGLPDVFDDIALKALLDEARGRLRPRARLKENFNLALKRAAQRILRWRAFTKESQNRVERQEAYEKRRREADTQATGSKAATSPPPATKASTPTTKSNPPTKPTPTTPSEPKTDGGALPDQVTGFAAMTSRRPLHVLHPVERARRFVDLGLSIIPLPPRSKEPAANSTWTDAQVRPRRIPVIVKELEPLGDDAGLAIICGLASGIVVADLDDESAVAWARENLPETPWRTKTRRGEHWFYRLPEDGWTAPASLPYKGQLQSTGRYVVAPGSIHPDSGEKYEAIGDWTVPKGTLPIFDNAWLLGRGALRRARLRIVKDD
jgi:hypothetical protein